MAKLTPWMIRRSGVKVLALPHQLSSINLQLCF